MENPKEKNATFKNVIILGFGFMLLMAAYLTTAAISQAVLQSAKVDDPSLTANGFISLAVVNGAFGISNFLAPSIVIFLGVRTCLVAGSALYALFVASFIYPNAWILYGSSAVLGFAAANVWVANGCYFTLICTKENIGKYLGIYWTIMAFGQLLGSAFVFWRFQGSNHIDYDTRVLVITVLTCVCISCSVTMLFLGIPKEKGKDSTDGKELDMKPTSLCSSFTEPLRLLTNKHMLLLIPPSLSNGLEICFFGSIFPTTVGFTEAFGDDARKLVGVAGIMIGVGSMAGGILCIFGSKLAKSSRSFLILMACVAFCLSSFLMYINHPNEASLIPTKEISWMNPPSIYISMVSAFLLGFGDGCISPQMTASIGVIWPENPSSALAVYRLFQATTCALGFYIGTVTGLYNQILIFVSTTVIGTASYIFNEILVERKARSSKEVVTQVSVSSRKPSYPLNEIYFKYTDK